MKLTSAAVILFVVTLTPIPTPALDRPSWMDKPGIVMAGSWEAPCYRGRGAGRMDFTLPPERLAEYEREHSPEMIAKLKDLGVNFIMTHGYKGAGMATEAAGMEDARRFAKLARKSGMRIGAYIGGTMLHEALYLEEPRAREWQAVGYDGKPIFYNPRQPWRYYSVRNHPGFTEYLQKPTRYAVKEIDADLIHFDNFTQGAASYDEYSKARFRAFLKARGKLPADPPLKTSNEADPLVRDWREYKCQALAEFYAVMSRFIRSLDPKCAVESNSGGVDEIWSIRAGSDAARLLPLGNAFWDESYGPDSPHTKDPGIRSSRIRTMKVGRLYNNSVFAYTDTPLDAAESMAFNLNCLGCVAWFQMGEIISLHEGRPVLPELKNYIHFFNTHQDLFRNSKTVADVAVLRTFTAQNFGPRSFQPIEQALIEGHAAWRIIFDEHLDALDSYRVVIAPEKEWLTPIQQQKLAQFAAKGGQVISTADIPQPDTLPTTLRDKSRILVDAPRSVAVELCQQKNPSRVLVHLVNYEPKTTLKKIPITLRLKGAGPKSARLFSPDFSNSRTLSATQQGDLWTCTLPELNVYAVLVIKGDKL